MQFLAFPSRAPKKKKKKEFQKNQEIAVKYNENSVFGKEMLENAETLFKNSIGDR